MSVSDVRGFGRGRAKGARQRIVEDMVKYMPRVKLEIFCRDELVVFHTSIDTYGGIGSPW